MIDGVITGQYIIPSRFLCDMVVTRNARFGDGRRQRPRRFFDATTPTSWVDFSTAYGITAGPGLRLVYPYALPAVIIIIGLLFGGLYVATSTDVYFAAWSDVGYNTKHWENVTTSDTIQKPAVTTANTPANKASQQQQRSASGSAKFYILPMPEITTWLIGNFSDAAYQYYQTNLNEEQAEVWLHRGLAQLSDRTEDPSQADVVILSGYLHFNQYMMLQQNQKTAARGRTRGRHNGKSSDGGVPYSTDEWLAILLERIIPNKLYVLAVPTWNPTRGNEIGLAKIKKTLKLENIAMASFGFERNNFWQKTEPDLIIPVPYVITPNLPRDQLPTKVFGAENHRTENFVFYSGDVRTNAVRWAGCNRTKLVVPLQQSNRSSNTDVHIVTQFHRLTQEQYHARMLTSDYCLILCGDTPTSRSLASSMLYGCIPIRVGSRWRGLCEAPCHAGWGWTVTHRSHLPFEHQMDWNVFPEVDEASFAQNPVAVLETLFRHTDSHRKSELRSVMQRVQMAWVYGWGNPVNATDFGEAASYAWQSLVDHLVVPTGRVRV